MEDGRLDVGFARQVEVMQRMSSLKFSDAASVLWKS